MNTRPKTRIVRAVLQVVIGAAGVAFIVIALRRSTVHGWRTAVPSWPRFAVAESLLVVGLLAASAGWRLLLGPHARPWTLTRGFYVSVLAKYVPGGIWQPIGQVGTATQAGIPASRAVVAYPVHAVVLAVSGAVVAAGAGLTASGLALPLRIVCGAGLGAVVLLDRRWMVRLLGVARRFVRRLPVADHLPDQGWIFRAFGLSVITVVTSAAAFSVLLRGGVGTSFAFAAAWTAGYLLVPVPNGLGVREAILVALIAGPTANVLGASIAHRIATMIAEMALAAGATVWSFFRESRRRSGLRERAAET